MKLNQFVCCSLVGCRRRHRRPHRLNAHLNACSARSQNVRAFIHFASHCVPAKPTTPEKRDHRKNYDYYCCY